jgi:hypothetical protein
MTRLEIKTCTLDFLRSSYKILYSIEGLKEGKPLINKKTGSRATLVNPQPVFLKINVNRNQ